MRLKRNKKSGGTRTWGEKEEIHMGMGWRGGGQEKEKNHTQGL